MCNSYLLLPPQVQPKAPLLQILRVAGAQEEVFTLKEVSCQVKCQICLLARNKTPEKVPSKRSVVL